MFSLTYDGADNETLNESTLDGQFSQDIFRIILQITGFLP